jgi:hypothetical protein
MLVTDLLRPSCYRSAVIGRLAALVAAFAIAAGCQTTPPAQSRSNYFYWSEAKAHELDYKQTIATAKELSPKERADLLLLVLNRFLHPVNEHDKGMFEDISEKEMRKLAANTRIEFVDLNGDGENEIVAQGNGLGPCGATGNCIVLVLRATTDGWKIVLDTRAKLGGGVEKIRVLETSTNGFRDIVLATHDSATERTAFVLRYDNEQYRERECYVINWWTFTGGFHQLAQPEIGHCAK